MNRFRHTLAGLALLVLSCLLLPGPAGAAMLDPAQIDPSRLLPPPPAAGSAALADELAELHAVAARSTPEMIAAAVRDADDQKPDLFNGALGFDVTTLPATTRLLNEVIGEDTADTRTAKAYFHRDRPWIDDPSIKTCVARPLISNDSYPSGHTSIAFSMGVVLASLLPQKSQAILARAAEFGQNRIVCGFHHRSDIAAGQEFGTAVGLLLMRNAAFRRDYDAAAAELKAAGKTGP